MFLLRPTMAPTDLFPGLELEGDYVTEDRRMATNLPGLFAAGDCIGGALQVSKAVGEGLIAGQSAAAWAAALEREKNRTNRQHQICDHKGDITMAIKHFKTAEFDAVVTAAPLAMVDFWADWCGPCKMITPVVEVIGGQYGGKVLAGKVNVDEEPELARRFGVMNIPTVVFLKNGKEMTGRWG